MFQICRARWAGLVTLGETLALFSAVEPGPLRHASHLRLGIGGAESNVAIGVRRLGGSAVWIGRVGDDELGELVLRTLRAEGVEVDAAVVEERSANSLMIKERRTATSVRVTYHRASGPGTRLCPDDVPPDLVRGAGVLHTTGITAALSPSAGGAVVHASRLARDAGVAVSHDVKYRRALAGGDQAAARLRELLPLIDRLFVGLDEAHALGWTGNAETIATELHEAGPGTVIVKLGRDGAPAADDGQLHEVAPVAVPAVDPIGAGDAFAAGYLAELLRGSPLLERLGVAAQCGAYAVTAAGDWESLPTRNDLSLLAASETEVVR